MPANECGVLSSNSINYSQLQVAITIVQLDNAPAGC